MSTPPATPAAARYDRLLRYAKNTRRLPPGFPKPQPTAAWPRENVALLEDYQDWLLRGGTSARVVQMAYLPMAGHVLGFNLKPHAELNLETDFQVALDYIQAKDTSAEWNHIRRLALDKFRQFLRQQRGQWSLVLRPPPSWEMYVAGLPGWLVEFLERLYTLARSRWRPARIGARTPSFWRNHTQVWRWLFEQHPALTAVAEVKRAYLVDYVDHALRQAYAVSTINADLRCFQVTLLYLQEQDVHVPQALLRVPTLKVPERLPRYLTDEHVGLVRDELERQVAEARFAAQRRDACLNRAAFYLLWQCGLRLGEVEELRLDDLDVPGHKLTIRQGKGQKDRVAYLTETTVRVVQAYLAMRGLGPSEHVFIYRHQPVHKDLLHSRVKAAGARVGVKVTPHQLRHTCATQLLNAGCRVTSIQKLLGHRSLDTTMLYARVHDRALADDYYTAMARIEQALDVSGETNTPAPTPTQVLELVNRLAEPQLDVDARLKLVAQLRDALA
jgi:site-specific recombinase XerD